MRLIAILVAVLLAGCDTEADMKIVGTDVQVLSNVGNEGRSPQG